MPNTYFPLHCHSHYSLLDGLSKPKDIAKRCIAENLPGSAITDHGSLAGAISFMSAMNVKRYKCAKCGHVYQSKTPEKCAACGNIEPDIQPTKLKPILGCEFYVCHEEPHLRSNKFLTHLILLAKNKEGWSRLIEATSEANKPENVYYKPRLDMETLDRFLDGNTIGLSGHMGSDMSNVIFPDMKMATAAHSEKMARNCLNPNWDSAGIAVAQRFESMFGKGNFYLEIPLIDRKNMPALIVLSDCLRHIGSHAGIPCAAAPDAHYARREDAVDQRVLLCNKLDITFREVTKQRVQNEDVPLGSFFKSDNYHIPSFADMKEVGHTDEELQTTLDIADMCEVYGITKHPAIPCFPTPNGESSNDYLKQKCKEGWMRRLPEIEKHIANSDFTRQDYGDRFKKEFEVLSTTKLGKSTLSDYFLIVDDIVGYAKNQGWLVGAGRGSAAGTIVLYLLGVTHPNPIEFDLLFERFYNAGRNTPDWISLPDVDMDFEIKHRGDIIEYIRDRYGRDRVAQMLTFTRMQGRGALKDVLRAHQACGFDEMNRMTAFIPDEAEISDQLQAMKEADKLTGGDGDASIIQWALENNGDELKQWAYLDSKGALQGPLAAHFAQAIRIEGTKRSTSKHASGIVIAPEPLNEVCPMVYDKTTGETIAGMEMEDLEQIGMVKFDILSVASLDKIRGALQLLKTGHF